MEEDEFLRAMNEPAFMQLGMGNRDVYRFIWLRTFHRPISIRVEAHDNGYTLVAKELDGRGGYEPGMVCKNISRPITCEARSNFLSLLNKAHYWELSNGSDVLVLDGAFWILEGYHNSEYHVVNRWCPAAKGPNAAFREACLYLVALSGIEIASSEVY
jgi:hypothetical protein